MVFFENLDALKMFIRPSKRRAGAADHMEDLVEFNTVVLTGSRV